MSRIADLVPLLTGLGESYVSGEKLADRLRLSRTAIWKQIAALKHLGFPIQSKGRYGYRLDAVADFSLSGLSLPEPLSHWAKPHYVLATPSTQRLAQTAAQAGVPEGHFWLAEIQSNGRGRLDRSWSSGYGGLWFSLVLRPQAPPSRAATVGLVAALALARSIEKTTGVAARLKWPNDVLLPVAVNPLKFKKGAGFLTQMSGEVDKTDWMVLGVGLNVFNRIPDELDEMATSLKMAGATGASRPFNRGSLLTEFLAEFYSAYRQWQRRGFTAFRDAYWRLYSRPNGSCLLKTAAGEIRGIARRIDASGAIIIESRRKKHAVLEGEIVL